MTTNELFVFLMQPQTLFYGALIISAILVLKFIRTVFMKITGIFFMVLMAFRVFAFFS